MKAAVLLMIMLTNEGHWLSGTEGRVTLSWSADAAATPCDLVWELKLGATLLGSDHAAMSAGESPIVKITCPDVRARVVLQWNWRLVRKEDRREIAKGSEQVTAYPANLSEGWAALLAKKRIVVVDKSTGIPALLEKAKVKHARFDDAAKLQTAVADMIIVGPDMLQDKLFEQGPLDALLQSGAAVVVFQQQHVDRLLGFEINPRALPGRFIWPTEDPLLRGLDADDLQSWEHGWARGELKELRALRVPENEINNAVGTWPAVAAQAEITPPAQRPLAAVDALLMSRNGGKNGPGRLVLCQMPLGDWQTDPRSQLFLGNVLDVLIFPPSPRPVPVPPAMPAGRPRSTITISPGDSQ